MAAPQQATPAPNAAPETENLLASVMDATLSNQMNELVYTREISNYMTSSGFFGDAKVSQSAVKIMLGKELGIAPVVSMMSIHIGKSGRPSLSGALHAALLKRAGYSWKFIKHDRTECSFVPYYRDQPILDEAGKRSVVSFTYDDAKVALLTGPVGESKAPSMYDKYGPDLLYNRAIVRFERRFAPEVTKGMTVYTPDELEEIEAKDVDDATTKKFGPDFRDKLERRGQEPATTGQENPAPEAALNDPPDTSERMAQSEPPAPPAIATGRPTMPEVRSQRTLSMPVRKI